MRTTVADFGPLADPLQGRADICGVVRQTVKCCVGTVTLYFLFDLATRRQVLNSEVAPKLGAAANGERELTADSATS